MLNSLSIRNLAIIEKSFVEFGEKFNVLTGETGAGKSIIVNAVSLLRGEKASTSLIRSGTEKAVIEAVFTVDRDEVKEILDELGIEYDDEIIIRRVIGQSKSKVFINDSTVTISTLQRLSQYLIGIEGQHSQQLLLQPKYYRNIIDDFSGLDEELNEFSELYKKWREIKSIVENLEKQESDKEQKIDFIKYQINEIEKVNPKTGEDEELQNEKKILSQAEDLIKILDELRESIYSGEDAVIQKLKQLQQKMETKEAGDEWDKIIGKIEEAGYILEDVVFQSDEIEKRIEINPQRLDEVTERIFHLSDLKRKYGPTIEDVLSRKEKLKKELYELENYQILMDEKKAELNKIFKEVEKRADIISKKRKTEAKKLEKKVKEQLEQLGMNNVIFKINIVSGENISLYGKDKVEISVSLNKGEELKPLNKTASGGELSRIMLALRVALGEKNPPSALIFDEIDSGIGGLTAEKVGNKLKELSKETQIIVITHLPQIAILSDNYYTVYKKEKDGRTVSVLRKLEGEEKIKDLARMYGKVDEETVNYVKKIMGVS